MNEIFNLVLIKQIINENNQSIMSKTRSKIVPDFINKNNSFVIV